MKKVGIKAIILTLFLLHIPIFASEWQKELGVAKALGIKFSSDNKTLLKCPRDVEKVIIPSCVNSIGEYALEFCYKLTGITIPNSVTHIAQGAFAEIKSVRVSPDHPTLITDDAGALIDTKKGVLLFFSPDYKGHYTIPDNVTQIGDKAFQNCQNLSSVTIPKSVTRIGFYAFRNCRKLSNLTIPDSVEYIGDGAFSICESLRSITIPSSIKHINHGTFNHCKNLNNVIISNGVTHIGSMAFSDCINLSSITIPPRVTHIAEKAFADCCKLNNLMIPNTVTDIEEGAFIGLKSVKVSSDHPTLITDDAGALIDTKKGILLFFPPDYKGHYTIPDNVTQIGDMAFYWCRNLNSVTIPKSVTRIGYRAFDGCFNLSSVSIPNSVIQIGDKAFSGGRNLRDVTIPDSILRIGPRAFEWCDKLKSVTISSKTEYYTDSFPEHCKIIKR